MEKNIKSKLEQIVLLAQECLAEGEEKGHPPSPKSTIAQTKKVSEATDVLGIANMISGCDESEAIEKRILDLEDTDARVLLCFYVSYKYFSNAWLTSGDVVRITAHQGVKVNASNASQIVKKLQPYLESGAIRQNGRPTPYRLNRKGVKHFEALLYGNSS